MRSIKDFLKIVPHTDHEKYLRDTELYHAEVNKKLAASRELERIESMIAKIPVRYRSASFEDFVTVTEDQKRLKQAAIRYVQTFMERLAIGSCLKFLGKAGTGKTFLALIMLQSLVKSGVECEYQPSLNFIRSLGDQQRESHQLFAHTLSRYAELPFMIIDEVTEGSGQGARPADWERHLLRTLIDARYQAKRCTLIISNRSNAELIDRLGEPIIDRLSHHGATLAFNWESHRSN